MHANSQTSPRLPGPEPYVRARTRARARRRKRFFKKYSFWQRDTAISVLAVFSVFVLLHMTVLHRLWKSQKVPSRPQFLKKGGFSHSELHNVTKHVAPRLRIQKRLLKTKPGYVDVRNGTFRDKYPSAGRPFRDVFDAIYVLHSVGCIREARAHAIRCKAENLGVRRVAVPRGRGRNGRLRANWEAQRNIWSEILTKRLQRTLVMDAGLFPSRRALRELGAVLDAVDEESVARQKAWHVMLLRRVKVGQVMEQRWAVGRGCAHEVVRAGESRGLGMYVVTNEGARWLLRKMDVFRQGIDWEVARLLREESNFVVLSACNNARNDKLCPEMVDLVTPTGSQSKIECIWRRAEEDRL